MKSSSFSRNAAIATLICLTLLSSACVAIPTAEPTREAAAITPVPAAGIANPASVFCEEKGGRLKIEQDAKGNQYGLCLFPDGSQCDEWAFFRGECKPGRAPTSAVPSVVAELTQAVLRNARYELPDLGAIELQDGKYEKRYGEGATQVNTAGYLTAAFGDLNKDGVNDAAAVLWWSGGGSGTFVHLVAMINDGGTPRQAATVFLGDRASVEALAVEEGKIVVSVRERLASAAVEKQYTLQGDQLVETAGNTSLTGTAWLWPPAGSTPGCQSTASRPPHLPGLRSAHRAGAPS